VLLVRTERKAGDFPKYRTGHRTSTQGMNRKEQ
jgi:hypothetical protein